MGRLVTVGVYGFTAERFLAALKRAEVDVLFDVRRRASPANPLLAATSRHRGNPVLANCKASSAIGLCPGLAAATPW
jgi:hypothetical protein